MIFWFLRKLRGLHGHLKGHVERIGGSTLVSLLAAVLLLSLGRAGTQIHVHNSYQSHVMYSMLSK